MRLGPLVQGILDQPLPPGAEAVRICDITEDSRTAVPGSLFVARSGLKADGRAFIASAVAAGAVAVVTDLAAEVGSEAGDAVVLRVKDVAAAAGLLAERFYGDPTSKLDVIAVTGTNGKSTITYLVWKILNLAGSRCGLIGTVITDDGREVASSSMTTPPAIELSRAMASMVEGGCVAAVMEASSHALDQKRADALKLDVGVFTNLTGDHLDYHKTMESYAAAKSRLFAMLDSGGTAIVNAEDPWTPAVLGTSKARVVRCRVEDGGAHAKVEQGEAVARVRESGTSGMTLVLEGPWGVMEGTVPLIGRYNAMNVVQAVAVCHAIGISSAAIEAALPGLTAPPGRLQPVEVAGVRGPKVYVDYAHSDDSLLNALRAVRGAMDGDPAAGRLWVVFGCGGDKDRTKRPRMGKAAASVADVVVVTSDNPRSENPSAIVKEVLGGIEGALREKVRVHVERDQAIRVAVSEAAENDVVVIAGKGHETEQIRMGPAGSLVSIHFDDREHAAKHLAARGVVAAVQPVRQDASSIT